MLTAKLAIIVTGAFWVPVPAGVPTIRKLACGYGYHPDDQLGIVSVLGNPGSGCVLQPNIVNYNIGWAGPFWTIWASAIPHTGAGSSNMPWEQIVNLDQSRYGSYPNTWFLSATLSFWYGSVGNEYMQGNVIAAWGVSGSLSAPGAFPDVMSPDGVTLPCVYTEKGPFFASRQFGTSDTGHIVYGDSSHYTNPVSLCDFSGSSVTLHRISKPNQPYH